MEDNIPSPKKTNWARLGMLVFLGIASLIIYQESKTPSKPKISIITSVWKGDEFIEGFLADTTKQTIFSECELIMINANSPGNEEPIIRKYMEIYPNIKYTKLEKDPGIYGVWNRAIKMASGDYIMNANLDDRSSYDAVEVLSKALDENPDIDLVYSSYITTMYPNETFDNYHLNSHIVPPEFSLENMRLCLPGPRPMWRKSFHDRYGMFDEIFSSSGDFAMWVRAASQGSQFKKIDRFLTLFYVNPSGLSTQNTNSRRTLQRDLEDALIVTNFTNIWNQEPKFKLQRVP